MTALDRLVNACLLPGFDGTEVPSWVDTALADGLAGVLLFPHNLDGPDAIRQLATAVRADHPDALVAIDEEGGDITRLEYRTGSRYPGNLALGVVDDLALTREVAAAIGADLVAAGVNYNLAPSLDVNSDPDNPVIGVRSFGPDPELVAAHGAAYIRAMRDAGIATAAKHFPGHGATVVDSHHALPVIDCDLETFHRRELAPFVAAIEAGVPSLMIAHAVYQTVDPGIPATLSRKILHDLVRTELGYQGVLLSTAPALEAADGLASVVATSVRSLQAGADLLLLGPADGEQLCAGIRAAVTDAVREGELDVATLEAAAARVNVMRAAAKAGSAPTSNGTPGRSAAKRAAQVTGDVALSGPATVVELRALGNVVAGEAYWSVADRLAERGLLAQGIRISEDEPDFDPLATLAADHPLVIVVRDAYRQPRQRARVQQLLAKRPDAVLVAVGMPDDAALTDGASIRTFGAGRVNTDVAAELLAGGRDG